MATLTANQTAAAFPAAAVTAILTNELLAIARDEAQLRGLPFPPDQPGQLVSAVPMDSLTIVDVLVVLDPVVGFEIKENIVQTGGYGSVQEALDHMVPRLAKAWARHNGLQPAKAVP